MTQSDLLSRENPGTDANSCPRMRRTPRQWRLYLVRGACRCRRSSPAKTHLFRWEMHQPIDLAAASTYPASTAYFVAP